jgi:hypothetical protein
MSETPTTIPAHFSSSQEKKKENRKVNMMENQMRLDAVAMLPYAVSSLPVWWKTSVIFLRLSLELGRQKFPMLSVLKLLNSVHLRRVRISVNIILFWGRVRN